MNNKMFLPPGVMATVMYLFFTLGLVWVVRFLSDDFLKRLDSNALVGILAGLYVLIILVIFNHSTPSPRE